MKIVILAGGKGVRLWPLSKQSFPKQFLKFGDDLSLLQKTVKRFLKKFDLNDIFVLTSLDYVKLVRDQLPDIQILEEPSSKNTAPALAFAVRHFQDEEVIVAVPSDHFISNEIKLFEGLKVAEEEAKRGKIVVFGIAPYKPATEYGYIQIKPRVQFVEKPTFEKAKEYLDSGNFQWNSGMVAFTPKTFWEEIHEHAPEMAGDFSEMPNISFDYAVLEKTKSLHCIPLDIKWSDLGSWESIFDVFEKDDKQNVKVGNVVETKTKNCLIYGEKREIHAQGFTNAIIIETESSLFLGKKGNSQILKDMHSLQDSQGLKLVIDGKLLSETQNLSITTSDSMVFLEIK